MNEIIIGVYFVDHLNNIKRIDNNIVDVEECTLESGVNKLFNTLTFVANGLYIDPAIVGDLQERITLKHKIDEEVEERFVIDAIEYMKDNNIKLYCKSKTIRYTTKYMQKLNSTYTALSLKHLISSLINDPIEHYNLTDVLMLMDYEIRDKSIEQTIEELSSAFGFEYYYYRGKIYFEDKRKIGKNESAIARYSEAKDIIEFSTTTESRAEPINQIIINGKKEKSIIAEPTMLLEINDSPQCCSPDIVIAYTDDHGNKYKINPVNAYFILYYSPLINKPELSVPSESGERIVIEEFKLKRDNHIKLSGGIKELIAIDGVSNYHFEPNFNILTFDEVEQGELKVTYKTDVLHGVIEHSKYPKKIDIYAKHFNCEIEHRHEIKLNGYYPVPYALTFSLVKDWGLDYADAIDKSISVQKYNKEDEVFESYTTIQSNLFGEATIDLSHYATYKFEIDGQEPLYLDWFVNKFRFYLSEVA